MSSSSVLHIPVRKVYENESEEAMDFLAREEPLEIILITGEENQPVRKNISVTMRTPGSDAELAAGFLCTEGIIRHKGDLVTDFARQSGNTIEIRLRPDAIVNLQKLDRHFYTTSSCGVCGKASVDAVKIPLPEYPEAQPLIISSETLYRLPFILREKQTIFNQTGGLHASALFTAEGEFLFMREDVGRHNALDKLIGYAFIEKHLPLQQHVLLLSGRASFELLQKAAMAGILIVVAVGAPSSLAVELAKECGITLIGFLRDNRFNIYCGEDRVAVATDSKKLETV